MENKKTKLNMMTTFLLVGFIPLISVAVITIIISVVELVDVLSVTETEKLKVATENLTTYFQEDISDDGNLDLSKYTDYAYIDSFQEDDIQLTLFRDNTRVMTSIRNEDGSRNEGTKANEEIYKIVSSGQDYTAKNVDIAGTEYCVYYSPIYADKEKTEFWGMAFAGKPDAHITARIASAFYKIVLAVVVNIIVFGAIIIIVSRKVVRLLKGVSNNLEKLANGTIDIEPADQSIIKELNKVIVSSNTLQISLKEITDSMKNTSESLTEANSSINTSILSASDSVTSISSVAQEVTASTEMIAASSQEISASAEELFASVEILVDKTKTGNESADEMKNRAENIQKLCIDKMQTVLDVLAEKKKELEIAIEDSKKVSEINLLTDNILEISSSTNLLALNATIEAARAGDAGRGFAVVARSIRDLADESKKAASSIQHVTTDVIGAVESLMKTSEEIMTTISEQVTTDYTEFKDAGETYYKDAETMTDIFDTYVQGTDALKETTQQVVEAINGVSQNISECADGISEVTNSIVNITSELTDIKDASENNMENVKSLSEQINKFH